MIARYEDTGELVETGVKKDASGRRHVYVRADCDECGEQNEIRKNYAKSRIRRRRGDHGYVCKSCSSRVNVMRALNKKKRLGMIDDWQPLFNW